MRRKIINIIKIFIIALIVLILFSIFLNFYLLDGLEGLFWSLGFEENTLYASGYSDAAFKKIKKGMSPDDVLKIIGKPLAENWIYSEKDLPLEAFSFKGDIINYIHKSDSLKMKKIKIAMKKEDVIKEIGMPIIIAWGYSYSPKDRSYRVRSIIFQKNQVSKIIHEFYVD